MGGETFLFRCEVGGHPPSAFVHKAPKNQASEAEIHQSEVTINHLKASYELFLPIDRDYIHTNFHFFAQICIALKYPLDFYEWTKSVYHFSVKSCNFCGYFHHCSVSTSVTLFSIHNNVNKVGRNKCTLTKYHTGHSVAAKKSVCFLKWSIKAQNTSLISV